MDPFGIVEKLWPFIILSKIPKEPFSAISGKKVGPKEEFYHSIIHYISKNYIYFFFLLS